MNILLTDSELRRRGVAAISEAVLQNDVAFVVVDDVREYAVVSIEEYKFLKECELLVARNEAESDLRHGRFTEETVEEHIKRITSE